MIKSFSLAFLIALISGCSKNSDIVEITFKQSVISYRTQKQPEETWADVAYLATIKNHSDKDFIYKVSEDERGGFAVGGINQTEIFQMKAGAPFAVLKVKPGDSLNILLYGRGGNSEEEFDLNDYERRVAEENRSVKFYFSPGPKLEHWKFIIRKSPDFKNENCLFNTNGNAYPPCLMKFWKK